MKNRSTPRKSNLLEDQRKLDLLMDSPGRHEPELRERLLGKNTLQAGKILAEEFVRRFGEKDGAAEEVAKSLLPAGRATTWGNLDINITLFCKRFYAQWEIAVQIDGGEERVLGEISHNDDEQVEFFDRVRYVLDSLPRQKDYKLPEHKAEYTTPSAISRNFATCFLCWRSVPRTKKEKKTPLCYVHDMMSTCKEYRRRKNMRQRMQKIFTELEAEIPTPAEVRQENKIHPRDFYLRQIRRLNGYFPALAEYLYELNPHVELEGDLIRALEHPIPFDKLTDAEKAAWEFHFGDFGAYFELNYERMLLAEAWLRAEAEYKHGGKR